MPPLYRLLSGRYLLHRWDRAALVVASIALGVATLVSARILNQCIETAAAQTTTPLRGAADLYVTNGELGVRAAVAGDLRAAKLPGVAAVQPLVFERISIPSLGGRAGVLIGAEITQTAFEPGNPFGATFTRTLSLQQVAAFATANARLVVLSRAVYDDWVKERPSETAAFVVRFGSRRVDCVPLGVIDFDKDSPLGQLGWAIVGMEIGQAARFVRPSPPAAAAGLVGGIGLPAWEVVNPPRANRIDVFLAPAADRTAALAAVRGVVGERASVTTPETQGMATQEIVAGLQIGFLLCSAGAMVVGLFLVYNALSVTVAERRHDIGVLRAVGATRGQVVRLFTAAAVLLGLVGAAVGVPLGVLLARVTLGAFRDELADMFLNPEADPGRLTPATALIAAAAGVATAVLAALVPAIRAASDEPADAVRRTAGAAAGAWSLAHKLVCLLLVGGGVGMILLRHSLPPRVGAFGGMLAALVGLLLAAPIFVGILVRLIQPILRRVLPVEMRLAADNLSRAPGRTGVVIGALGAGVAVMIQTAGVGLSNEVPISAWLDEMIRADEFVYAGSMIEATTSQAPMEPSIVRQLGEIPGVERAVGMRYLRPEFNGTMVFLIALDAAAFADATQARSAAAMPEMAALRQLAGRPGVVVSDNFVLKHGIGVGDMLALPGPNGPVTLPVIGTIRDYSWSRGTVFIDRAVYAPLFDDGLVDGCHVFLKDESARDRVRAFTADRGLVRFDRPTVRKFFAEFFDRVYKLAYLQQIVVGVVAALGVVTALLISVLQRKRELGLLLAVGATPTQVVRSVLAEAALMGAFGTLLGVLIGLPLEWYVVRLILVEESGFTFPVVVPWAAAAGITAGAMTVATLAGLLPALHAVRTRIVDALAYE